MQRLRALHTSVTSSERTSEKEQAKKRETNREEEGKVKKRLKKKRRRVQGESERLLIVSQLGNHPADCRDGGTVKTSVTGSLYWEDRLVSSYCEQTAKHHG